MSSDVSPRGAHAIAEAPSIDELPYQLHTGRELSMMLSGEKPLSYFSFFGAKPDYISDIEGEFADSVEHKNVLRFDASIELPGEVTASYVIYTIPSDAWRADALILLKQVANRGHWSEGLERYEGFLLGYSDTENDAYIAYIRSNGFKI